jgi:Leucine rich repeat
MKRSIFFRIKVSLSTLILVAFYTALFTVSLLAISSMLAQAPVAFIFVLDNVALFVTIYFIFCFRDVFVEHAMTERQSGTLLEPPVVKGSEQKQHDDMETPERLKARDTHKDSPRSKIAGTISLFENLNSDIKRTPTKLIHAVLILNASSLCSHLALNDMKLMTRATVPDERKAALRTFSDPIADKIIRNDSEADFKSVVLKSSSIDLKARLERGRITPTPSIKSLPATMTNELVAPKQVIRKQGSQDLKADLVVSEIIGVHLEEDGIVGHPKSQSFNDEFFVPLRTGLHPSPLLRKKKSDSLRSAYFQDTSKSSTVLRMKPSDMMKLTLLHELEKATTVHFLDMPLAAEPTSIEDSTDSLLTLKDKNDISSFEETIRDAFAGSDVLIGLNTSTTNSSLSVQIPQPKRTISADQIKLTQRMSQVSMDSAVYIEEPPSQIESKFKVFKPFCNLQEFPDGIDDFTKHLFLEKNQISSFPSSLNHMVSVRVLNLSDNRITHIPADIAHMSHLKELNVSSNMLVSVAKELAALKELQVLDLSNNKIEMMGMLILI